MEVQQRRILELVADGSISAVEAAELINALKQNTREARLKLEILSSRQEVPLLELSMSVRELPEMINVLKKLSAGSFQFLFQSGKFRMDFRKLNWSQILELALRPDTESIYFYETQVSTDETISLQICVEK